MNHLKIYKTIIEKAKSQNRKKLRKNQIGYVYYENHHIQPKCLGGTNDKENLVLLTAREHYVCHKLLIFIYPEQRGLILAIRRFMHSKKLMLYNISSRDYDTIKNLLNKIPQKSHYESWIDKFGKEEADKRLKNQNDKIRKSMTGVKYSDERRKNAGNGHIGIKMSESSSIKKRESMKGKNLGKTRTLEQREKISKNTILALNKLKLK